VISLIFPIITYLLSFLLGNAISSRFLIKKASATEIFYSFSLGIIFLTIISYLFSLVMGFTIGAILGQVFVSLLIIIFNLRKSSIKLFFPQLKAIFTDKWFLGLLLIVAPIVYVLFDTHIIPSINGDLYTGESTYGDLPYHLSMIVQIAYGGHFPPDNPMFAGIKLVYPYLINFFSSILVFEGSTLRDSVMFPGIILTLSLLGLIYDLGLTLTKKASVGFLTALFYFFNGGVGFYYFLKDYSFNLFQILQVLSHPTQMKEYSHLFSENIQWGNFLSRIVVPERSILFGIPAGIIMLRILIFRGTDEKISFFEIVITAILASFMPLLHTHTVITFFFILPILLIYSLRTNYSKDTLHKYLLFILLTILFALIHIPTFFSHLASSSHFMTFHLGWMTEDGQSVIVFWLKNSGLLIPLALLALILPKNIPNNIKVLQVCGLLLLLLVNTVLFSPYNWDNVKLLFWIGIFFAIAAASIVQLLVSNSKVFLKVTGGVVIFTLISTSILSILREINVQYILFPKDAVSIGELVKKSTQKDALFLTYPIHNSPVSNLAGRQIMMGYPGYLWTQGVDYQKRYSDIQTIFAGDKNAKQLIAEYKINYIIIEDTDPEGIKINQKFFNQYQIALKNSQYTIYQMRN
jgi:hypothetical protein